MNVPLDVLSSDDAIVALRANVSSQSETPVDLLHYETRTGALLRVNGAVCGAFDRDHATVALPQILNGEILLDVERRSLPTTGLPPGDGVRWRWLLARALQEPSRKLLATRRGSGRTAERESERADRKSASIACVGHSHLDVAWLWTYEEAARKATRTLATAARQLDADPNFIFTQSQPQLFAFVAEREPAFFERVRSLARAGRLDTSGAALWVEPDCNLPSGESLLRQLAFGMRYVEREFGRLPSVAWLPDSFGFPNTLPTLLAHAGIGAFATTKLGWNDTTVFPHAQFVWEGPDGRRVLAAQIASLEGGFERRRVRRAQRRGGEVLLVGRGDGGGGVGDETLAATPSAARWTTLAAWFAQLRARARSLPVVRDELYLEEHRGTLTTHHDMKARNARLERALGDTELLLAWALVLHATPYFLDEARRQLAAAWETLLRAQFHDVLPGSAISEVYLDAHREYDEAEALVAGVAANARSVLPQAAALRAPAAIAPRETGDGFEFAGAALVARVRRDGTLCELRVPGGPNLVRRANRLALYVDRPKRWDAWNVDRGYRRRPKRMRVTGCEVVDDGLELRYAFGASLAVARIALDAHEPFLRVDVAVEWRERHRLLRCENELAFAGAQARFGSPHGWVERNPAPRTRAERAKFEAAGQRFARVDGGAQGTGGAGPQALAIFALDTYGWSVAERGGVTALGHSLLRGPTWPDAGADRGEHAFSLAYVPCATLGMGELEALWKRFAHAPHVPMFVCDDPGLLVVATKPADDGDGVIVRVRECDGARVDAAIRIGARALAVACVDALERPAGGEATLQDGAILARFAPFELRSFRVFVA